MKIQCGVCEKAEGTLFCCADQAVLCHSCDEKVHAANKLASRHYRAALLSTPSSSMAKCDICQDSAAYIFCLEDRALYCRMCDVAIHNINDLVKAHQRYLLTGIKVGLEVASGSSSSGGKCHSGEKISDAENRVTQKRGAPASTRDQCGKARFTQRADAAMPSKKFFSNPTPYEFPQMQPVQYGSFGDINQTGMNHYGDSAAPPLTPWPVDDFLALSGFSFIDGLPDNASSRADDNSGKSGDDSSYQRSIEDDVDSDDQLGQVPDVSWTVPQMPSPPTASGLYWPKTSLEMVENAVFVPDIGWSQATNYHQ